MKKYLVKVGVWVILMVFARASAQAQTLQVYPGDVNNNGIVNNVDFMYLGLAYNFFGPARSNVSPSGLDFAPQEAEPWLFTLPNGTNMAYADCNGDGLVNYYYDAFPLYVNYGSKRADSVITQDLFPLATAGADPQLRFDHTALPNMVQGGQHLSLPIELGTAQLPAEDLYGLAFSIHVDPQYINSNQVSLDFTQNSWANPDGDRIFMYKKVDAKRVDVAWTRTDFNQKTGYGKIGRADIIIVVDVIGLQQNFKISIDSVKMIDRFGNTTAVAGDTVIVKVDTSDTTPAPEVPGEIQLEILPNPASEHLSIRCAAPVNQINLIDALGRPVLQQSFGKEHWLMLDLPELPQGIYLLEVLTEQGRSVKTIQIQN